MDCIFCLMQYSPAHNALDCQVSLASGRSLGGDWRRRPGRPRARWTDQLCNDTRSVHANLWPFYSVKSRMLGGRLFQIWHMMERRDGPSWLRDDDNTFQYSSI